MAQLDFQELTCRCANIVASMSQILGGLYCVKGMKWGSKFEASQIRAFKYTCI